MSENFPDVTADLPPVDAPAEPEGVLVRVSGPQWTSAFQTVDPQGDTLVVTREGVRVPEGDVNDLISAANANGVFLDVEVSET